MEIKNATIKDVCSILMVRIPRHEQETWGLKHGLAVMRMLGIRRNQKTSLNATCLLATANMWQLCRCQAFYQWVLQLWSFVWRLVLQPSQEDVIRGRNFQAVAWTREREDRWPLSLAIPRAISKQNKKSHLDGKRVSWEYSFNQTLYL